MVSFCPSSFSESKAFIIILKNQKSKIKPPQLILQERPLKYIWQWKFIFSFILFSINYKNAPNPLLRRLGPIAPCNKGRSPTCKFVVQPLVFLHQTQHHPKCLDFCTKYRLNRQKMVVRLGPRDSDPTTPPHCQLLHHHHQHCFPATRGLLRRRFIWQKRVHSRRDRRLPPKVHFPNWS